MLLHCFDSSLLVLEDLKGWTGNHHGCSLSFKVFRRLTCKFSIIKMMFGWDGYCILSVTHDRRLRMSQNIAYSWPVNRQNLFAS